jgi:hypothetical protein
MRKIVLLISFLFIFTLSEFSFSGTLPDGGGSGPNPEPITNMIEINGNKYEE